MRLCESAARDSAALCLELHHGLGMPHDHRGDVLKLLAPRLRGLARHPPVIRRFQAPVHDLSLPSHARAACLLRGSALSKTFIASLAGGIEIMRGVDRGDGALSVFARTGMCESEHQDKTVRNGERAWPTLFRPAEMNFIDDMGAASRSASTEPHARCTDRAPSPRSPATRNGDSRALLHNATTLAA